MRAILFIILLSTLFFVQVSHSQKIETGLNMGFADASFQNTKSVLKKSVLGYNVGLYIEQFVSENVSLHSVIQFIRRGGEVRSRESTNLKIYQDFIQFSIMPKF